MEKKKYVAQKIEDMPFSGIRKFFDIAAEMDNVISLGVGEPDFKTPLIVRQAAIKNIESGSTKYTSNAGLLELREEVGKYLENLIGLQYSPREQIVITVGASEGIDIALRALLNPGDEVLCHEPCYVSYKPCIMMAGGVPVAITTKNEDRFKLKAEDVEKAITPKTKALLLNFPNNPTGAIMEKEDLEKLANVLKDKDIIVISDEIYAELTYGGVKHASIASMPGMYEKTVVINGFSKAFAMTGWRLAYAAGPEEIISAMTKIHQYTTMSAPTTSQIAGVEAIRNAMDSVNICREAYDKRRRFVVDSFRKIGMDCFEPLGAFYTFPSIQKTGMSSDEFCERLLQEQHVAVVPGTAFGQSGEGFVRVSYAYSIEELEIALRAIAKFLEKLK